MPPTLFIIQLNPFKLKERLRLKKITTKIRDIGRHRINERVKNPDSNSNDLLNLIIEACSEFFFSII